VSAVVTFQWKTNAPARIDRLIQKAPIAQVRALNRAITSARVALVRVVSQDMGLKAAIVAQKMIVKEARELLPVATLKANTKKIELIEFRASGPEPSRGRGRGVSVYLQGARVRYPRYFIARGTKTGRRHVFERPDGGKERGPKPNRSQGPIRIKFGPSIYLVARFHRQVGIDRGREALIKNLKSEFRFVLAVQAAA
jgi:hypothetical protein